MTIEIDVPAMLAGLGSDPAWRQLGNNWVARAKIEAPRGKSSGGPRLYESMVVRFNEGSTPSIDCGSELTRPGGVSALDLIHSGTVEHEIVGKNSPRKLLRFRGSGGSMVFVHRVHHRGTKPNLFVERAAQQALVMAGGAGFAG